MDLISAITNYFSLNARETNFYKNISPSVPEDKRDALAEVQAAATPEGKAWSIPQQIIMYLGIFAGVACSTWVTSAVSGKQIEITSASLASLTSISGVAAIVSYLVIPALIALLIVPIVYGKLDPSSPGLVKFAVFFQSGVTWPILLHGLGIIQNSAGI